jgi:hypothetical protein
MDVDQFILSPVAYGCFVLQPTIHKVPKPATMRLLRQRITPNRLSGGFSVLGERKDGKNHDRKP